MYGKWVVKGLVAGFVVTMSQSVLADAGGQCCPFSDQSLKQAVKPLDQATGKVLQLQGVQFQWKDSGREDIGLLAQNVKEVYPQVVYEKGGLLTVDYDKLVAPLIESVRELNARIEVLERQQAK